MFNIGDKVKHTTYSWTGEIISFSDYKKTNLHNSIDYPVIGAIPVKTDKGIVRYVWEVNLILIAAKLSISKKRNLFKTRIEQRHLKK